MLFGSIVEWYCHSIGKGRLCRFAKGRYVRQTLRFDQPPVDSAIFLGFHEFNNLPIILFVYILKSRSLLRNSSETVSNSESNAKAWEIKFSSMASASS
jgi:hypothetical protein